ELARIGPERRGEAARNQAEHVRRPDAEVRHHAPERARGRAGLGGVTAALAARFHNLLYVRANGGAALGHAEAARRRSPLPFIAFSVADSSTRFDGARGAPKARSMQYLTKRFEAAVRELVADGPIKRRLVLAFGRH